MMLAQKLEEHCPYAKAEEAFAQLIEKAKESDEMTVSEWEKLLQADMQKICREILEAKMNMVGKKESEIPVKGSDGVERPQKKLVERKVETTFGEINYERVGYGAPGAESLFPADGYLNLPPEKYTHEVRRLVSEDVARASFDDALEVLSERTGAKVPKRQGLELSRRAAQDFVSFYDVDEEKDVEVAAEESGPLLILTTDGKGVVMRPDGLREPTRKAAEKEEHKLKRRLSRGEKGNRKRMAQVASVYTIKPHFRTAEDVAGFKLSTEEKKKKQKPPRPENKRVWASVEREPEEVIDEIFKEAQSRDPGHQKQWLSLVDGNKSQLKLLKKLAESYGVTLTIIIDIVHVLEYLWKASRCFYEETDPDAEKFVTDRLLRVLHGQSIQVGKGMRKMATDRGLPKAKRKAVDTCAAYLHTYREYLHYDQYLERGLPIATGVIEGACRHLVKDRMDITGARWGLSGAEAVLRLRSLRSSGDFQEYWTYHEKMEQVRNHISKYENGLPPLKSNKIKDPPKGKLRLVK